MEEEGLEGIKLDAELYKSSLERVMNEAGLDVKELAADGCICCDVGEGTELLVLSAYEPRFLIASEPITQHYSTKAIEESLKRVTREVKVELIREDLYTALSQCKKKKIKAGLVTWLNIYPDDCHKNAFINFFREAKPLLRRGGAAIATVDWAEPLEWREPGELISAWRRVEESGYKVRDVVMEGGSLAGGVCLIGINE